MKCNNLEFVSNIDCLVNPKEIKVEVFQFAQCISTFCNAEKPRKPELKVT